MATTNQKVALQIRITTNSGNVAGHNTDAAFGRQGRVSEVIERLGFMSSTQTSIIHQTTVLVLPKPGQRFSCENYAEQVFHFTDGKEEFRFLRRLLKPNQSGKRAIDCEVTMVSWQDIHRFHGSNVGGAIFDFKILVDGNHIIPHIRSYGHDPTFVIAEHPEGKGISCAEINNGFWKFTPVEYLGDDKQIYSYLRHQEIALAKEEDVQTLKKELLTNDGCNGSRSIRMIVAQKYRDRRPVYRSFGATRRISNNSQDVVTRLSVKKGRSVGLGTPAKTAGTMIHPTVMLAVFHVVETHGNIVETLATTIQSLLIEEFHVAHDSPVALGSLSHDDTMPVLIQLTATGKTDVTELTLAEFRKLYKKPLDLDQLTWEHVMQQVNNTPDFVKIKDQAHKLDILTGIIDTYMKQDKNATTTT